MPRPKKSYKTERITVTIPANRRGDILFYIERIKKEETVKAYQADLKKKGWYQITRIGETQVMGESSIQPLIQLKKPPYKVAPG